MHVLLVDDDSFLRDMYATKFVEAGHQVDAAATGEEGLRIIEKGGVDVVLLDMVMPGMTGLDFLKKANAVDSKGGPKFVVLSNQSEDSDKDAADKLGAIGYIVKAESVPSDVVAKVEKMCK